MNLKSRAYNSITALLLVVLFTWSSKIQAQLLSYANGFPVVPVYTLGIQESTLYLGTEQGVYELSGKVIVPSQSFKDYSKEIIYGFSYENGQIIPVIKDGIAPVTSLIDPSGHTYELRSDGLQINPKDQAAILYSGPAHVNQMANGHVVVAKGGQISIVNELGVLVDEKELQGIVFAVGSWENTCYISSESGLYSWSNGRWKKLPAQLPVFAIHETAKSFKTPLGWAPLTQVLSNDFTALMDTSNYVRAVELADHYIAQWLTGQYYGSATIEAQRYYFTSTGVHVEANGALAYSLDVARGLPPLRPGTYSAAVVAGELFLGAPNGLYKFTNGGLPATGQAKNPKTYVNGVAQDWKDIPAGSPVLSLVLDGVRWEASPLYARYALDGEWTLWNPQEPLLFQSLNAGKYELVVEWSAYANFSASQVATYSLRIPELWYKQMWLWIAVVLVLALAVVAWYRRRANRLAHQIELEHRLAEAEMQAKRSQMNPHFLFNALDSIGQFIFQQNAKDAVLYMGKLAKLMRLTLEASRSKEMVLADELELLRQYLDICVLRYGDFEHYIELEESVDPYVLHIPPLLVQPLVENAVQHGMRPLLANNEKGEVHIHVSYQDLTLTIEVKDNGKGGLVQEESDQKEQKSHGLNIIKERLALLQKQTGKEFSIELTHTNSGTIAALRLSIEEEF